MITIIKSIVNSIIRLLKIDRQLDEIKINQGLILTTIVSGKKIRKLHDSEFKIFSQWGEDGIIQYLISNLEINNKTFIEFGIEDFSEANCRFLLMKDNWSGFVIDGSESNIKRLRSSYYYWKYSLQSKVSFITRDNINTILEESGFDKDAGILSVDIDGVDYYVLSSLDNWTPSIIIVEYNAIFGCKEAVSVPYDPSFVRSEKHHSNLYYGASLPAFDFMLQKRNYALVGTNSAGSNAFFVRRDLLNNTITEQKLDNCFIDSKFREGRDTNSKLSFVSGDGRRKIIENMPLTNIKTGETLKVRDLS